ncbi:MAG TPA: hypothetical protein VKP65_17355 [Rhodothermales bacterium]|nr:hypothetical protein [Rhodothermales bacterium]
MRYLLLLTLPAFVLIGTWLLDPDATSAEKVPARTLIQSTRFFSLTTEPAYVVLRSVDEETRFLEISPRKTAAFPYIDYTQEMVVGIALGRRGAGNTRVSIDSVITNAGQRTVYATEHAPCIQQRYVSNPAHFVALPKSNQPVRFAPWTVETETCR